MFTNDTQKTKVRKRSNVNMMNLLQNSQQYSWNIFFSQKHLSFAGVCCRRKQNCTIIIQEKHNRTNLHVQHHDYLIKIMLTLIYVISMEFPSLRHRPLSCEMPLVARTDERQPYLQPTVGGCTHFFWNYTFVTHNPYIN